MKVKEHSDTALCDNCPFASRGPGARLRRSLRPSRMAEIKRAVLMGAPFYCHKTTDGEWSDDGEDYFPTGRERVCGGSVRYFLQEIER